MKLTRCHIYQFGKLKEALYEFPDGITLIQGKNESGKSTLHTALAALIFGAEKSRGRAAKDSIYRAGLPWQDPQLYGGSLSWEREGRHFTLERDFAKNPPRLSVTEQDEAGSHELPPEQLPWPPSFSPYLYFNTLSFRQQGSAVDGHLAQELRSHIINLQSSGNETIDMGAALTALREKKREQQKQLQPEAESRSRQLMLELTEAQQLSFAGSAADWDEDKARLARQEEEARQLSEERSRLSRELKEGRRLLKERGLLDPEKINKDRERAQVAAQALENYEESYAPTQPSTGLIQLASYLSLPFMLVFFWIVINAIQTHRYPLAALGAVGFFVSLFVSIRFSRKQDAQNALKHNQKVLTQLFEKYAPHYEPEGISEEARELSEYLEKVSETFRYLEDKDEAVKQKTETLSQMMDENQSLGQNLEQNLSRRMEQERWELKVQALRAELDSLAPVLENNRRAEEEIKALDLAINTLNSLAANAYSDFGAPLTEQASRIFAEITGGRYQGLRVSNRLELFAEQDHQLIAPESLSGGTLEQLYFSFRMAMIQLLWPREPMPLFFDDSFAFYDGERLGSLLEWLHRHYPGQVLLFSCQDREKDLLEEKQIPYHEIVLS